MFHPVQTFMKFDKCIQPHHHTLSQPIFSTVDSRHIPIILISYTLPIQPPFFFSPYTVISLTCLFGIHIIMKLIPTVPFIIFIITFNTVFCLPDSSIPFPPPSTTTKSSESISKVIFHNHSDSLYVCFSLVFSVIL